MAFASITVALVLLFMLGFVGLLIVAMISIYKWASEDAKNRGMDSPVMWGLIVVFVPNLIGLIIYLVVREGHKKTALCTQCGQNLPPNAGYCPACGTVQTAPVETAVNPAPKRHLVRFGILLGCAFVLMIGFIISMSVLSFHEYGSNASAVSIGRVSNFTGDEYKVRFALWEGKEERTVTVEEEIICFYQYEDGEMSVRLTLENGEEIAISPGEVVTIPVEGKQKVKYTLTGKKVRNGTVELSWN